VKVKTVWMIMH